MDNNMQIEILERAIQLKVVRYELMKELNHISFEQYNKPKPSMPERPIAYIPYPEIDVEVKYDFATTYLPLCISAVFLLILPPLGLIGGIASYVWMLNSKWRQGQAARNQVKETEEYKQKALQINAERAEKQKELDAEYEKTLAVYNNETLPKYQKELDAWHKDLAERKSVLKDKIKVAEDTLKTLFDSTKILPEQYRDVEIMKYIVTTMKTSDYDVKEAIAIYDRNELIKAENALAQAQEEANQLMSEEISAINRNTRMAQASIAATTAGAIEARKTNKKLDEQNKLIDKHNKLLEDKNKQMKRLNRKI